MPSNYSIEIHDLSRAAAFHSEPLPLAATRPEAVAAKQYDLPDLSAAVTPRTEAPHADIEALSSPPVTPVTSRSTELVLSDTEPSRARRRGFLSRWVSTARLAVITPDYQPVRPPRDLRANLPQPSQAVQAVAVEAVAAPSTPAYEVDLPDDIAPERSVSWYLRDGMERTTKSLATVQQGIHNFDHSTSTAHGAPEIIRGWVGQEMQAAASFMAYVTTRRDKQVALLMHNQELYTQLEGLIADFGALQGSIIANDEDLRHHTTQREELSAQTRSALDRLKQEDARLLERQQLTEQELKEGRERPELAMQRGRQAVAQMTTAQARHETYLSPLEWRKREYDSADKDVSRLGRKALEGKVAIEDGMELAITHHTRFERLRHITQELIDSVVDNQKSFARLDAELERTHLADFLDAERQLKVTNPADGDVLHEVVDVIQRFLAGNDQPTGRHAHPQVKAAPVIQELSSAPAATQEEGLTEL